VTIAASRRQYPLAFDEYAQELRQAIAADALFIAEEEDGRSVGMVKLDRGRWTELSWTVAPEARQQGYGRHIVAAAIGRINGPIVAEIRVENLASVKIAEANGFIRSAEHDGLAVYRRT